MISVCMATYNGEKFIKEQIDSILCQLSEDDELIISDDGSTDKTLEIINSYDDKRIKLLFHNSKNISIGISELTNFYYTTSNFENALKCAKGDYIFLADQDDIWEKDRINLMIQELHENDLVMCNFSLIDGSGKKTCEKFYDKDPISKFRIINIIKSKFIGCCMAFTRVLLDKSLPFPPELMAHDYWIGCLSSKYKFIDISLHRYRRHGYNVSPSAEKSQNSFVIKIKYRLIFLFKLYKRILISKK